MEGILHWLISFPILFWKVIVNYCIHGFPFALAHLFVFVLLVHSRRLMLGEADVLAAWQARGSTTKTEAPTPDAEATLPSAPADDRTRSTDILDQFVDECDHLGDQGFFVPMTDFSDRLDSIVDGLAAEFHDRANLFIVVGVAGSMLGIFEFAFNSHAVMSNPELPPSDRLTELGKYLSDSLSKAFPVGFVGLVLTFVAQLLATNPERRLRSALAGATGRALQARREKSRAQAQIVQESAKEIKAAMQPLENLEQTLKVSVQPAVDKLGEHLDESLKLVKTQFDEMQTTNAGTQQIVREVNEAIRLLEQMVNKLGEQAEGTSKQAEETRKVNESTIRIQEQQKVLLSEFNETASANLQQVRLINHSLINALQSVDELPRVMQQTTQMKLDEAARDTLSAWRGMSDEIKDLVVGDHNHLLDNVAIQADKIQISLAAASSQLLKMAQGTDQAVDGLTALPPHLLTEFRKSFNILSTSSGNYWNEKTETFVNDMQAEFTRYLRVVSDETQKVQTALQGTSEELSTISRQMGSILSDSLKSVITEAKQEIEVGIQNIDRVLVQQYPEISRGVVTLSQELKTTVEQARSIQQESVTWVTGVQSAYEKLAEINLLITAALEKTQKELSPSTAEQTLALLNRNALELERLATSFAQVRDRLPSSEQIERELSRATDLLTHIHDELRRKSVKKPAPPVEAQILPVAAQVPQEDAGNGSRAGWFRKTYDNLKRRFGGE